MRVHLEQEDTQEKEKFFQLRESFLDKQNATWDLAKNAWKDNIPKKMWTWHIIFKTNNLM